MLTPALCSHVPFFCFSRMMAAASSLVFWYCEPVWVFLFFCKGVSRRPAVLEKETHCVTGFFQGLGPIIVTLITPSHVVLFGMRMLLRRKKSWRGRWRGGKSPPLFLALPFLSLFCSFTSAFPARYKPLLFRSIFACYLGGYG